MFSLDDIRIASPCKSDWNQMYGDDRRRFCQECKLNVYNLSGMTRDEAERLVMNSEGRLCVRFFRRKDGTVLTQDCPVGWKAIKRRASRIAVATTSAVFAFVAGLLSIRAVDDAISLLPVGEVEEPAIQPQTTEMWVIGQEDLAEWEGQVSVGDIDPGIPTVGRVDRIQQLKYVKVKAWVK